MINNQGITSDQMMEWLRKSNGNVYVSCMGEDGYPNISVRHVEMNGENALLYTDNANSRTVQLMMQSPKVIVNLLSDTDPYHGCKMKGEAKFEQTGESSLQYTPVRVTIILKEMFPY
ncbi:pyridoxamine 5'-phosphate oxidase family protein [Effusibacillus dendaii]|uniref:Pyridoxamine 5'-phosphate oxidase putative domain-containing protein n=1 Tax=Effusibacillus dendaii TaxID=2743772 RepID=A0A7I8D6I3_9BACL|nr:pyridoxamine 5'-phosphate oxidase family protein [Effusibacillus dendaii]BCJ85607.1 hypothetical protein skT53_05920 [Effusibacillus dendaii]